MALVDSVLTKIVKVRVFEIKLLAFALLVLIEVKKKIRFTELLGFDSIFENEANIFYVCPQKLSSFQQALSNLEMKHLLCHDSTK